MIRILHIVPNMQFGGIETFLMNIYREIDRTKIQFDFLVHYKQEFHYDKEIEALGGKIFRLSFRNDNNIIKYVKDLNCFFSKHNEYKIIHGHMMSTAFIYMRIAKKNNVPVRIVHSHDASYLKNFKGYIKNLLYKFAPINANKYFACSKLAGNYLYKNDNYEIINNVIDLNRYKFKKNFRDEIRGKYNLSNDDILIGHIGRFNLQKNHKFLIDLIEKLQEKDDKYYLLLIGKGELKNNIIKIVKEKKLVEKVIFVEEAIFPEKYYSAMDIFVLPSLFEGLPLVGVEAQATNLPCVFSKNVTKEIMLSNNSIFLSLDIEDWVNYILSFSFFENRDNNNTLVEDNGFSAKSGSVKLQEKYIEYYNEVKEKKCENLY